MSPRNGRRRPRTHDALLDDLVAIVQQHQDPTPNDDLCDPVGSKDIAERLNVQDNTAHTWQKRGLLPPPRWTISGQPAWDWNADIVPWARETGRMPV